MLINFSSSTKTTSGHNSNTVQCCSQTSRNRFHTAGTASSLPANSAEKTVTWPRRSCPCHDPGCWRGLLWGHPSGSWVQAGLGQSISADYLDILKAYWYTLILRWISPFPLLSELLTWWHYTLRLSQNKRSDTRADWCAGFRIRSDIDRIRIRIQPLRTNRIRIRIRIQTPLSRKFSIYFMMSFNKKLLPFSFFDGP